MNEKWQQTMNLNQEQDLQVKNKIKINTSLLAALTVHHIQDYFKHVYAKLQSYH